MNKKKLLMWNGIQDGITIGKTYLLDPDGTFVDDEHSWRDVHRGVWEDIKMDNIFEIHSNEDEQYVAIAKMKEGLPHLIEMYQVKAKLAKEYYDALIEQGFSEDQTLKIVSNFSLSSL